MRVSKVVDDLFVRDDEEVSQRHRTFLLAASVTAGACFLWALLAVEALGDHGHGPALTYALPLAVTALGLIAFLLGRRIPRRVSGGVLAGAAVFWLLAAVLVMMIASEVY